MCSGVFLGLGRATELFERDAACVMPVRQHDARGVVAMDRALCPDNPARRASGSLNHCAYQDDGNWIS
jgi:hypothetical protein